MTPAQQLVGFELEGGWKVIKEAERKPNATGGSFSHGYIVENKIGERAYLKALDYLAAFRSPDLAAVLRAMTTAYMFEKEICEKCARLSRIARAIGSGTVSVGGSDHMKVQYLIFELANGDVRSHLSLQEKLNVVFIMKTLHHVAVGLEQLHGASIAHQDLKPSNVLVFAENKGSKIGDLGCAWDETRPAPHDAYNFAGDMTYAPIEVLYNEVPTDQRARRYGGDMYQLGSLVAFLFAQIHATTAIMDNLNYEHRPIAWAGSFEEVIPFLQAAFDVGMSQVEVCVPQYLRDEVMVMVGELCNPNYRKRGHPANRGLNQFSLKRYITKFNRMMLQAKLNF